jgi:prephenate dehydratase
MKPDNKIIIQGYPGCFHEEAAVKYFESSELLTIPARTFPELAKKLLANPIDHLAIIAIENSIAGSLLQNYRILREHHFRVIGEVYLRIRHNLMALPGEDMMKIREVHSHPMALNQCLDFLNTYPEVLLVESEDTALSAKRVKEHQLNGVAAIGSATAARIYDLNVIAEGIETSKVNYTRFFIIQDDTQHVPEGDFDKASIYLRVKHEKGSLMKVLQHINDEDINMSKLQSYPVLGEAREYFFHIDLEFEQMDQYRRLIRRLEDCTIMVEVLGVYNKAKDYDHNVIG